MQCGPLRRAWMDWMMGHQRRAYSCPAFDCYAPCNGACPDPGCFPQGTMLMLAGLSGQRACKHKPHGIPHACLAHRLRMDWRIDPSSRVYRRWFVAPLQRHA